MSSAPVVIYEEDFENGSGTAAELLEDYSGATGVTYSADPPWLTGCNGLIVEYGTPDGDPLAACAATGAANAFNRIRQLARVMGQWGGSDPLPNRAVAAYTQGGHPGANAVEFRTESPLELPANVTSRYLTFSVDAAAINCAFSGPHYSFSLIDSGGAEHSVGGTVAVCSNPGMTVASVPPASASGSTATNIVVGTYTSNGSFLFSGTELGIVMRNQNGSGTGNDAGFDNIRILDVTPQLDKAFVPQSAGQGQPVRVVFTVTNTSELAAKAGFSFTDTLPSGLAVAPAPNAASTCGSPVTDADPGAASVAFTGSLAAGQVSCTFAFDVVADAEGTYVHGPGNLTSVVGLNPPLDATLVVENDPSIELEKDSAYDGGGEVGDVISYTFTATNTGNVTLTGVEITDPLPGLSALEYGVWPGAPGVLQPNQSITATAAYVLTQADLDEGAVDNTATATGTDPTDQPVASTDSEVVPLPVAPAVRLVKDAVVGGSGEVGDTIDYSFTATNTGNVTLIGVQISDPLPGLSALTYGEWPGAPGELEPGESVTATATYVLNQADIDAGGVDNTASVVATPPTREPVDDSDEVTVPLEAEPAIDLVKDAELSGEGVAGDEISYAFTATNTGNVTLTGVEITDPLPALSDLNYVWPGEPGVLAPGESVTASATYVLTQADLDAGGVDNTATATGTPPTGEPVEASDEASVPIDTVPAIDLVKTAALLGDGAVGDTVAYTFIVTNSGDVTLAGVEVADPLPGLSAIEYGEWPAEAGVLAPGESVTATATYALTQADLDAGSVENTASASGTDPDGDPVDATADADVLLSPDPAIALIKDADLTGDGAVGDVIEYGFTATNTGDVTLTGVEIADPLEGLSALAYEWPGVPVTATDDAEVPLETAPAIALEKSADLDGAGVAGDTVRYRFVVTNTGDVTLFDVTIADPLPGLSQVSFDEWPGDAGVLVPGASVSASATYVLTQADVDAGRVDNTATASGAPLVGDPVSATDDATVPVTASPAIELVKSGELAGAGMVGDTITFDLTATNTGNVTLTDVEISDPLPGLSALTYAWPGEPGVLAPGEAVTASAVYVLTVADVAAADVDNAASVTGTPPGVGKPVTGTDEVTITVPPVPAVPSGEEVLPKTGGESPWPFAALGLVLVGTGVMVWTIGRRRRNDIG